MAERLIDYDGTFFRGCKSDSDPGQLPLGYYWNGINVINIGGTISCRPGYRCLVTFPQGNLQGSALFRPQLGLEQLLAAIDGVVYVAEWPFLEFRILPNVQFSPYAKQIYWALTTQSANRLSDDFSSAIEVIDPKTVLIMQDGGSTAPAWYDGALSGHIRNKPFQTPAGGPMAWVGDRLWVGKGNQVFASDISNPFSFREQTYLGGNTSFFFADEVTALVKTPSIESPQLMVFTDSNASIVQASLRDREQWPTTVDFQVEILQIGAPSQRGVVSHYGRVVWMAPQGMVFFDPATSGKITTRMPIRDNEMMVSKVNLNEDLSLTAIGAFGQFLCISVPSEDLFNKHTWVLNHASLQTLSDDSGPSWSGYWLGTRPVEWVFGEIAGAERIFHVSSDADGNNRLWEAFIPNRLDNGCPITWGVETRGYFGQTTQAQKIPGSRCRMAWADIALAGIAEDLDLGVFFAPGVRGAYTPILRKRISVAKGSLDSDQILSATSQIFAFKPQSRVERTEDANQQSTTVESGSCGIERDDNENIDESFQLLIVGHGPATIRWIRPFAFAVPEDFSGDPTACVNEIPFNTIRFDGAGAKSVDISGATNELAARALDRYTSNKTVVLDQEGFTAVGVGFAESIVAQQAADRVAEIIATKQAESELRRDVPPVISAGVEFDPEPAPNPPVPPVPPVPPEPPEPPVIPTPVADFSATPLTGLEPLDVTFTNSSLHATSYLWDFGDSSTSTDANPVPHTYLVAGTYTVSLTATGPGGSNTLTRTAYVSVSIPCPELDDSVLITAASPASTVFGAGWHDERFDIRCPAGQRIFIRVGDITTAFGPGFTFLDSTETIVMQTTNYPSGGILEITAPTDGDFVLVFSAFNPGAPDTSFTFTTDCTTFDEVPCTLPPGIELTKYRIVGYVDGMFDVSGCGEGPDGNPAWDGTFPDYIGGGDWEADGVNFPSNFSISGVLLAEASIFYSACIEDGTRMVPGSLAQWQLVIWVGAGFTDTWAGYKNEGATAAGTYTRLNGCAPGPATVELELY